VPHAWDDGSGSGNYFSDYTTRYPAATNDGNVWDTPYVIDSNNQDNYPLVDIVDYTVEGDVIIDQLIDETTGETPVTLTFEEVTSGGDTTLTTTSGGPPPPSGFKLGKPPTYFDISTTATFTGSVKVCIDFSGISYNKLQNLRPFHYEDTDGDGIADAWVALPIISLDTVNKIICFETTSFSSFAIYELIPDLEPPEILDVVATPNPVAIGTSITLTATIDDSTTGESIITNAEFNIDGGAYMTMAPSDGAFDETMEEVTANIPAFSEAGLHTICIRGEDSAGNVAPDECFFLVVYDPSGGFVTGGGWIDSPPGAYVPDPTLSGKANFGFVAKYKKGQTTPEGNTEFQFKAGNMNFHSDSYDWLVIAGAKAQFKGTGSVNEKSGYKFMLWATDGDLPGGQDVDLFRIKIWEEDEIGVETVIYDNKVDTELGGGSIVIHSK
jgi:hypothetical protein